MKDIERLCGDLRLDISGQYTRWRELIFIKKKVVVTLYRLIHGNTLGKIACKADIGWSTVHDIL